MMVFDGVAKRCLSTGKTAGCKLRDERVNLDGDDGGVSVVEARIRLNTKQEAFYFEQVIDEAGG